MHRPKVNNIPCVILYLRWLNGSYLKLRYCSLCELILAEYNILFPFCDRVCSPCCIYSQKIYLKRFGGHYVTLIFHLKHSDTIQYCSIVLITSVYVECISGCIEVCRRYQLINDVSLACQELHIVSERHVPWKDNFNSTFWIDWEVQSEIDSACRQLSHYLLGVHSRNTNWLESCKLCHLISQSQLGNYSWIYFASHRISCVNCYSISWNAWVWIEEVSHIKDQLCPNWHFCEERTIDGQSILIEVVSASHQRWSVRYWLAVWGIR